MASSGFIRGRSLGHYRIVEEIGAGGMGVVFRARDEQLDRDVALKVLPASSFRDPAARSRLLREARAAAALNHPHICTVYEVGEADGQMYIAMELVEGQTLSASLAGGALPPEQVLGCGVQLAGALGHAHERGVLHRDLKSANVIITGEGRAKVLDFGLAKRFSEDELGEVTRSQASLTAPGAVVGTLAYMAPEQLRGQPADARSDVWALGVVLYEMATGALPFRGQTGYELSSAILNQTPAPVPAKVPLELRTVVERCLEKEPGRRYQRASEVRAALETIRTGEVVPWAAWRYQLARRRWLALAITVVALLLVAAALNFDWLRTRLGGAPRVESVAVLPLENLSGDTEQDYLAEGVHEALITDLAKLSGMRRVIARASVMSYRKTDKPLPQIARELGVDALITGSVLRSGDRVQIAVHLIQAATQQQLWGDRYERQLRDVLSLQNDIVAAITRAIQLRLTPQEQVRLAQARPVNPETYDAYLKGMFYLYKKTPEGFAKGLALLQRAIEKDPTDPLPYAGLALAYPIIYHGVGGAILPRQGFPQARAAAVKALELDEGSPQAHLALGAVKLYYDWDWAGGEKEFRRALELNPNLPEAHAHYGWYLHLFGRIDEGLAEEKKAEELDPLSPVWTGWVGWMYLNLGEFDKAIGEARKALDMDPNSIDGLYVLGSAYGQKKMFAEAIATHQKLAAVNPAWKVGLAETYAAAGRKADALRLVAEMEREDYPKFGLWIFGIQTQLGNKEEAFRALEAAFAYHHEFLPWVMQDNTFPWRSDPRWLEMRRRLNFRD
jgi:serine/threonine-protein kinase